MTSICSMSSSSLVQDWCVNFGKDLTPTQNDAALNNTPLWIGEWSLLTEFNATDEFLYEWADAQKLAYNQGAGWLVRAP